MKNQLSPSILSANFSCLYEDIQKVRKAHMLHVDVMDGHFVPNLTIGPVVVSALAEKVEIPFDIHLMIEKPDQYIESFIYPNTHVISVHQEACPHLHRSIQHIKSFGVKAGVALNPATPVAMLEEILEEVDMVILMTVNPGFGGQSFIQSGLRKITALREMIEKRNLNVDIQVDGGIKLSNAKAVLNAGANILVAGSAIFSSGNPEGETDKFLALLEES